MRSHLMLAALLSGCVHTSAGPPAWIARGSGPVLAGETRVFVGVGSKSGSSPSALLAASARSQARAAVAEVLSSYLNAVLRPWVEASPSAEELPVAHVLTTWTRLSLARVMDAGTYQNDEIGTVFARAELALDEVIAVYQQAPELAAVRAHHRGRAPLVEAFDATE